MDYSKHTIHDFLLDESFQKWARHKENENYWWKVIGENPEKKNEILEAKSLLNSFAFNQQEDLTLLEKRDLKHSIKQSVERKHVLINFPLLSKIAAVFLLVTSISLYLNWESIIPIQKVSEKPEMIERLNGKGKKSVLTLSDGTKIWLNSESFITFPKVFAEQSREVELSGEAYFEVAKNPEKPFIIKSGAISTVVLGTSFNINAYPSDSNVEIALVEGKVKVLHSNQNPVFLEPNELLVFDKSTKKIEKEVFDLNSIKWKDGLLYFNDASINEITEKLSRWYNVSFNLKNTGQIKTGFSGNFSKESLEEVLTGISYVLNFEYKINDKSVEITGKLNN